MPDKADKREVDVESGLLGPANQDEAPGSDPRIEELSDKLLRALADADNANKRADRARLEGRDAGVAEVTASLVPALDSLSLAIDLARRRIDGSGTFVSALLDGLESTRRAFGDALARHGVDQISPERGAAFDPNSHEAVATRPDETVADGAIVDTLQAGYRVGARLIRPARVVIASDH